MKIDDTKGRWILVYPVSNLFLTPAVKNEITPYRTTFIRHSKFKRTCASKLGLPLYSELCKSDVIRAFFTAIDPGSTLAVIRQTGELRSGCTKAEQQIATELDVLALSSLYWGEIRPLLGRTLASGEYQRIGYLAIDSSSDKRIISKSRTPTSDIVLDEEWHKWKRDFYFNALLDCLRGTNGFTDTWRETMLRAVTLVSEGLSSKSLSFSFLHNMIALETIFKSSKGQHSDQLIRGLSAFIGWSHAWTLNDYKRRIESIYAKRNKYVHEGDISQITKKDVEFTDHLLHNVFHNILVHARLFKDQDTLLAFSDRIAAEQLLGVPPEKSKYLPRTMGLTIRE